MTPTELHDFWIAVRTANRACLADLRAASDVPRSAGYGAYLNAANTRRLTTESLRVFRPLERALQALQQANRCPEWARAKLTTQVVRRMGAITHLCRAGALHVAYLHVALPIDQMPFSMALSLSPIEGVVQRARAKAGVYLTPGRWWTFWRKPRGARKPPTSPRAGKRPGKP